MLKTLALFLWGKGMGLKDNQVLDAVNKSLSHFFNILEHQNNDEELQKAIYELQKSSTIKKLTQVWVAYNEEEINDGH